MVTHSSLLYLFYFTGEVPIRNDPISIGCVEGQNFTGAIDEVKYMQTLSERVME